MANPVEGIREISRLGDLRSAYDVLLCDIWGVVHNGRKPFDAAVSALQAWRRSAGVVVLITNSPKPSGELPAQFREIGVPPDIYDHMVSSGDVTRLALERHRGQKVWHVGPDRDGPLMAGLDLEPVGLEDADFILCSGPYDDETEGPDDYAERLAAAHARNLDMICANPDIVVQRGDKLIYCAGALAAAYEALGGTAIYAGKPHAPIYERCLALASDGGQVDRSRVLVVGDGPKTDIRGAVLQGFDSLFISGGIHASDCFDEKGHLDRDGLERVFGAEGIWPTAAMPWLTDGPESQS